MTLKCSTMIPENPFLESEGQRSRSFVCSFVLCGQESSLLWTPALRPFESVQCASPGLGGELIGVCGVRAM